MFSPFSIWMGVGKKNLNPQGFPVISHMKTTGWWLSPTPLKNDGVRQLGLWNSQYMESYKIPWFQTTNQTMQWSTLTFTHSNLKMVEGNSKEPEPIPCQISLRVKWDAVLLDTIVDSLHAQSQRLSQKRRIQTAVNHLKHCTGSMYYTLPTNNLRVCCSNVLLVKIKGPIWYTSYHLPVVKGVSSKPSINQPTNGKRTSMVWYPYPFLMLQLQLLIPILAGWLTHLASHS